VIEAGTTRRAASTSMPPIPLPSTSQRVPGLDGLRALAVVAVLLFHAGYLDGGFLGVDLFFALSGFLITSLLLRDARGRGVAVGDFWGRRARRLLPALLTMLVVVALWAAAFGSPADLDGVRGDGPWALFYVANWHFIAEAGGYWQSFAQPGMFDHLWSLAIEEQFYLLWPLVIIAVWRRARRPDAALLAVCIAGIVVSFALMVTLYHGGDPTRVYMGTDTRAASLLAGAVAATGAGRRFAVTMIRRLGGACTPLVAAVGGLVVWSWVVIDGASSSVLYRGGLLLHSLACGLVVVLVASAPDGPAARTLGWRPLAWIGVMSYGLYLWHWPVYVVLSPDRTGWDGPPLLVLRVALTTVLAVASYHLVEDPIRRRAAWARTRRGLPALVGSFAGVAIVFGLLPTPATQIAAFDPSSVRPPTSPVPTAAPSSVATSSTPAPATVASTTPVIAPTTPATAPPTTPPPPTAPPATAPPVIGPIGAVAWAGDSVAYDLAPGIKAALTAAGVTVDVTPAFPAMYLVNKSTLTTLRILFQKRHLDTVIVQLSEWDADADEATQSQALSELSSLVLGAGARLVIVDAPPGPDATIDAGIARMAAIAAQMSSIDPTRVVYLDPVEVWSPTAELDLDGDGTPERKRDHIHVCPSGAARFAAWLSDQLAARFTGVTPAPPTDWAATRWVREARYDDPVGACAPLG
jgi:peptidoglycan/LPS O-acetylase OafA/YrhL